MWRRAAVLMVCVLSVFLLGACGGGDGGSGGGEVREVVIGAAWPLSGPYAFNGQATLAGAEAAVEDINNSGGIQSLDGAKLRLQSVDVGSTPEQAASAVQRLVDDRAVVAVAGSWLSSLTLAATEVSERARVPFVTESFSDQVTGRGFQYVFDFAPPSSKVATLMVEASLPSLQEEGITLRRAAIIGDNTAAAAPLQEALASEFATRGIAVPVREQWAPPLQDASGVVQKIVSGNVDAVFLIAYSFNDVSNLVSSLKARGVTVPIIQNGGQALVPQWRDVGQNALGLATFVITHPLNKSEELSKALAQRTNQPYVWQDQLDGYLAIQLIAAALEEAGEADRDAVRDALATMKLESGPAVDVVPTEVIQFDETGRLTPPFGVLVQWQTVQGVLLPCTVYPKEYALCDPKWK